MLKYVDNTSHQFIGGLSREMGGIFLKMALNPFKSGFVWSTQIHRTAWYWNWLKDLMFFFSFSWYLWSWRILFASWSVLTRVHMNNYCTGQWNAKDANTNDLASEWPIVASLRALASFCMLRVTHFCCTFLFSATHFRTTADFAYNPICLHGFRSGQAIAEGAEVVMSYLQRHQMSEWWAQRTLETFHPLIPCFNLSVF